MEAELTKSKVKFSKSSISKRAIRIMHAERAERLKKKKKKWVGMPHFHSKCINYKV